MNLILVKGGELKVNIRINKFKFTKAGKVSIQYEQYNPQAGSWDEYSLTCADEPRPELRLALATLSPHVVDMCELPEAYLDRIKVNSVSFSYGGENEVMGAVIVSQMSLKKSSCDLNLNTPHKISEHYNEHGDAKQLLSDDCIKDLYNLCDELELYIQGERAQINLFAVQ